MSADDPRAALDRFDRALADGDADGMAEVFAADAQLLLLYEEPIVGRDAIRETWTAIFAANDTADWRVDYPILDLHGDRAYALAVYEETMVPRNGDPAILLRGRAIYFLRSDAEGRWRIALAMNSHSHQPEEIPGR